MKLNIESVHFDASEQLKNFIEHKVAKLDLFHNGIISADVILRLDKSSDTENKVAEISLKTPNCSDLFAKKQCKTFEESVDLACEALRKQLIKAKDQQ